MNIFKTTLKIFLYLTVLTGLVYPLLITLIAQLTMPYLANGSLIYQNDKAVGSLLIAQSFSQNQYFWPRPSAIDYNPLAPSGGSNLGPTSQRLKTLVEERKQRFEGREVSTSLLYASGSGLDPHLPLDAVYDQIPRVAKARHLSEQQIKLLVDSQVEGRQWGLFGPLYLNILHLNWLLDDRRE